MDFEEIAEGALNASIREVVNPQRESYLEKKTKAAQLWKAINEQAKQIRPPSLLARWRLRWPALARLVQSQEAQAERFDSLLFDYVDTCDSMEKIAAEEAFLLGFRRGISFHAGLKAWAKGDADAG